MTSEKQRISLIVPVFNEEEVLGEFKTRIGSLINDSRFEWEVIFIDDGSADKSQKILKNFNQQDPRIKIISFSRNFGHQIAITAGINEAMGDAVVIMDVDLQDPPEIIEDFIKKWQEGYEVVYGVRKSRLGETWFKKQTAAWYYKLIHWLSGVNIPENVGDFRLIDRKIVEILKDSPEQHRFIRGLVAWAGFNQIGIEFERPARFAGKTKYPYKKLIRMALDSVVSFSILPLRLATLTGVIAALCSFIVLIWTLVERFIYRGVIQGWASLMTVVLFLGSAQLITIGILGEYIGRNFQESKKRPLYIIKEKVGF
ncbi:MAG: glycosyltransferase family 2 protein [Patescibacteria group bacterium]